MSDNDMNDFRTELGLLEERLIASIEKLAKKVDYITNPVSGLYLSVHVNSQKYTVLKDELEKQEKRLEAVEKSDREDREVNSKFRTQVWTTVAAVQTFIIVLWAIFTFWKG